MKIKNVPQSPCSIGWVMSLPKLYHFPPFDPSLPLKTSLTNSRVFRCQQAFVPPCPEGLLGVCRLSRQREGVCIGKQLRSRAKG